MLADQRLKVCCSSKLLGEISQYVDQLGQWGERSRKTTRTKIGHSLKKSSLLLLFILQFRRLVRVDLERHLVKDSGIIEYFFDKVNVLKSQCSSIIAFDSTCETNSVSWPCIQNRTIAYFLKKIIIGIIDLWSLNCRNLRETNVPECIALPGRLLRRPNRLDHCCNNYL